MRGPWTSSKFSARGPHWMTSSLPTASGRRPNSAQHGDRGHPRRGARCLRRAQCRWMRWTRFLSLSCAACALCSTSCANDDACNQTISAACASGAIHPYGASNACGPPSAFVVSPPVPPIPSKLDCTRYVCGDNALIVVEQTDGNAYLLTYEGDELVQVYVTPWTPTPPPYCLAGSSATSMNIALSNCSHDSCLQ